MVFDLFQKSIVLIMKKPLLVDQTFFVPLVADTHFRPFCVICCVIACINCIRTW